MSHRKKIDKYLNGIGLKITAVRIKRAKPVGRMPDDIRARFETRIAIIKRKLTELEKLDAYADQMSPELRHLLADEMQEINVRAERLARTLLGGDRDLRKIRRPLCDIEIPIRKEEIIAKDSTDD